MEDKKQETRNRRVVVKIGSSSLQHPETGDMNLIKMEHLARELCDLRNQGNGCLPGIFRSYRNRKKDHRSDGTAEKHFGQAGVCRSGAGKAHDDLSENVCGIQPDGRTGSDDEEYNDQQCFTQECAEYV